MLRSSELFIEIDKRGKTPPYLQIVNAIVEEILKKGRLKSGTMLPSTRDLAEDLAVNRKTVILAYDELVAQGWLTAERARGTFVSRVLPIAKPRAFAFRASKTSDADQDLDLRLPQDWQAEEVLLPERGYLMFDDGAPDARLVPVKELARAYRRSLIDMGRTNSLGYGDPRGRVELRSATSDMLNAQRGLNTNEDMVCLTRGSQMAIFLAARVLTNPGDIAVMEALSYPPAKKAFSANNVEVMTVRVDNHGINLDDLESVCRKKRVRCLYLTPHHQYPTTVSLSPPRRVRLLALAEEFGFTIIEDDYDHEFHYTRRPLLPLASAGVWGRIVYIGSLSKLITPSLRSGYIVGTKNFIDRLTHEILYIDRQGDPATELAVTDLMTSGDIRRHAQKVVHIYDQRRHLFSDLLRQHFGAEVDFDVPDGGLAFWVRFPTSTKVEGLVAAAAANRVKILPGSICSTSDGASFGLRLGFGSLNDGEIADAVARLARCWRSLNN